jgi:hypothetical protein
MNIVPSFRGVGRLTLKLYRSPQENKVLVTNKRFFQDSIFNNGEKVLIVNDFINNTPVLYGDRPRLQRDFEVMEKRVAELTRKYAAYIPEPEPEPPPPPEQLPLFEDKLRYDGMWVFGHPDAGKTQIIQYHIMRDLMRKVAGERRAVIAIDSQGINAGDEDNEPTLSYLMTRNALFAPGGALYGNLIVIDPPKQPCIPFNIFHPGLPGSFKERFGTAQELVAFVLTALMGDDYSRPMRRLFYRCTAVLQYKPDATLTDMRRMLRNPSQYQSYINQSPEPVREWFAAPAASRSAARTSSSSGSSSACRSAIRMTSWSRPQPTPIPTMTPTRKPKKARRRLQNAFSV